MGIVDDLVLTVTVAFVAGLLAHLFRLPVVLGYIAAGLMVGPHTPGPTVMQPEQIETLAEIGVGLLMFGIGLEFPLPRLLPVKGMAVWGTLLQMSLTAIGGAGLAHLVGFGWVEATWFGACVSLSSTMVVLKFLSDNGLMAALSGRLMLAILVVQDLVVIPMMLILPEVTAPDRHAGSLMDSLLRTAGVGVLLAVLMGRLLPLALERVLRTRSRELFSVSVLVVGLAVGSATHALGLSFAFGAFLAGLVLSETDFSHQALTDLGPMKDLFGMLFFASVGMLLDPHILLSNLGLVALLSVGMMMLKGVIFLGVTRLFGYRNIVPIASALTLSQVGEFSFVLSSVGLELNCIGERLYNLVLAVAVVTMVATPFLAALAPHLYRRFPRHGPPDQPLEGGGEHHADHVILAGYGSVGSQLGAVLKERAIPVFVIERDLDKLEKARLDGLDGVVGDASSDHVLHAAGLDKAKLVVLAIDGRANINLSLNKIQSRRPDLAVLARAASLDHLHDLAARGVEDIVLPELEASAGLLTQTLTRLELPAEAVLEAVSQLRRKNYKNQA